MSGTVAGERSGSGFRHEALLYAGADDFVERVLPFLHEGLAAEEPILVVVGAEKIRRLRAALNGSAEKVAFADMAEVGANPARIIPAWSDFLSHHSQRRPVRGIGEPIWAGRGAAELAECQLHESLLNLAFAEQDSFRLLCPYDTDSLDATVIDEALHSHPVRLSDGIPDQNDRYRDVPWRGGPFDQPLPDPPAATAFTFERLADLQRLRAIAAEFGATHGLTSARAAEVALAVHEAAANTIRHSGGGGRLRIWAEDDRLICEIRDQGTFDDPLIGRVRPPVNREGGRGVWLIQQLADLAQIRTGTNGTTVRIHFTTPVLHL